MQRWKLAGLVAGLIAAGIAGAQIPGSAQKRDAKGKDSSIGYVDLAQVTEQIKQTVEWQQMVRKYGDETAKLQNEMEDLTKQRYLTAAERQDLQNLRAKKTASDGEKGKIAELEGKSAKLDQEYQTLAMVEKPTEDQKNRVNELTKLREKASGDLQGEYDRRQQALNKIQSDMLENMQDRILKIVSQMAENRNLSLVVDRQAILYGGADLTQDVLNKLGPAAAKQK
jgi:Skp family chaperone for outer membrane proteins